jgi:alanine racemase
MHTRPVWAEISRKNLIANYLELRRLAGSGLDVLAVVKANAYGHGMKDCAQLLTGAGAEWIGVTSVEEGIEARAACPGAKILILSGIWHGEGEAAIEHRLTPVVWEDFHLELLEAAARRFRLPAQSFAVHLEIDTGMSRQGVQANSALLADRLGRLHAESPLRLDGVATHFSAPEVLDGPETPGQAARFAAAVEQVVARGLRPAWVHAGNSASLLRGNPFPLALREAAARLGAKLMLRPGLSLYGCAPRFTEAGSAALPDAMASSKLGPVLAWKSLVTSLRAIETGESAGYNSTFRAARPAKLALLPMGYADGLNRLLSNRGTALVRGRHAPIAGRVSMDQTILDVTDIPEVAIGDEAVIIGSQGEAKISAYDLADLSGTIPYEVLCNIAARVPRVLVD